MSLEGFKQAAQELAGLSDVPCVLVFQKTNKVMKESNSFQSAAIESGAVFILVPEV